MKLSSTQLVAFENIAPLAVEIHLYPGSYCTISLEFRFPKSSSFLFFSCSFQPFRLASEAWKIKGPLLRTCLDAGVQPPKNWKIQRCASISIGQHGNHWNLLELKIAISFRTVHNRSNHVFATSPFLAPLIGCHYGAEFRVDNLDEKIRIIR